MFDRLLDYLEYKYNTILINIYIWSIPIAIGIIALTIGTQGTPHQISGGKMIIGLALTLWLALLGKKEKRERDAIKGNKNIILKDGTVITYPSLYAFFDINEIKCTKDGKLIDNLGAIDSFARRRDNIVQVMRNEKLINDTEISLRIIKNTERRQIKDVFEGMWIALQTQADKLKKAASEGTCDSTYAYKMIDKIMEARDACVAIDAFCTYLLAVEKAKGSFNYVKFGVLENHLRACLWRAKNIA